MVALGFVAMVASSPGQTYWLSLFVDDMIAGTGLGRTGFSVVYACATVFSAAIVLVVGAAYDRRGPALTWALVALALAAGSLLMSVAAGALVALVALGMLRAFGQGSFPLLGTLLVARTFGVERLSELQSVGDAARIAAAAVGPLPLAIATDATGSYAIGLGALWTLALACTLLSTRWPRHPTGSSAASRPTSG